MFEIMWKRDNETHRAWSADFGDALIIAHMLRDTYEIPSTIQNRATGALTYTHVKSAGERVNYGGLWWTIETTIPGLDMVVLRPYGRSGDSIKARASEIQR